MVYFLFLPSYLKSVFAAGAYNRMLSFCFRETKHRLAFAAFAVNVSLSVSETVFTELEKVAESVVFKPSFSDVP